MTHFGGIKSASLSHAEQILAGIHEHGSWALVHASQELRRNAEFFLQAVATDGGCLMYAADELCADEKVVLAAVTQDGHALHYASPQLRADPHFALECVKCSSEAMLYIASELRQDPHFTLQAALNGCSTDLVNPRLRIWLERRDELLNLMRETIDKQDLLGIREVIKEAEDHGLPDQDLQEPRMAVKKLIKYSEVTSLWEPLKRNGDGVSPVVLLRGRWLCQLAQQPGARLPRRQDLPAEAVWEHDELQLDSEQYDAGRHLPPTKVVAISYCWHRLEHPDPEGVQLQAIAALTRSALEDLGSAVDLAIFWDFCSLFQEPFLSALEEEAFQESLKHVAIWYAHKRTQVWVLTANPENYQLDALAGTALAEHALGSDGVAAFALAEHALGDEGCTVLPYDSRGWPTFERNVAGLLACEGGAGQSILLINDDIIKQLSSMRWHEIMERLKAKQAPPKVPSAFCDLLATKTFSRPRDMEMLQEAYSVVFEETMHTMRNLVYCDLGWGDRAAADLSLAVKACFLLVNIELEGNNVADEGCGVLFEAFTDCASLAQITLRSNRLGDQGARYVTRYLPQCLQLEELDLSFNKIGNAGAQDFIEMFGGKKHPSLKELRLNNNIVGSSFKVQLAGVVQEVQGNNFSLFM